MQVQIFTILAVAVAGATAQGFTDCGSSATVNSVTAGSSGLNIKATAGGPATQLPYTVKATVLGIPITLVEGDACEILDDNGECPITTDGAINMTVSSIIPGTGALIPTQTEVKDQNGATVICANLPIAS